jgi:exodeoxyribonuclease VII large subunit
MPGIKVIIYPTPVQGEGAGAKIAEAIGLAGERTECDVLIVCRGGGSIEDLWAYNEEVVARAIRACPVPVVSGVGHETDFTIADFAADLRAPRQPPRRLRPTRRLQNELAGLALLSAARSLMATGWN